MLIDTHAHLNFPDFDKDLNRVIQDAQNSGVEKIICVSSNIEDSKKAIEIAQKYPKIVYAAVGIHPHKTDPDNQQSITVQLQELEKLAKNSQIVAIGECGLDYSPSPPREIDRDPKEQVFLFESQIKLAKKLNLPLSVHSRKATDDTITILQKHFNQLNKNSGVWHCYSAGKNDIPKISEVGFLFGLDGNLTYDQGLQNVVKNMPLERIVLETDCPFLAPLPYRGLRNVPENVKIIAESLAQTKGLSFEEVCSQTSQNVKNLFFKTR